MNPTTQSSTASIHPARQQRILRLPEVKVKTGFGRSTIYALMDNGGFPRSIRIGARAVGWLENDIDWWIETRVSVLYMAVDKPLASNQLPAGFAYNTKNWLVMQPAGQDSPVKICSWLQVAARTRDQQRDTSLENKGRLYIALVR